MLKYLAAAAAGIFVAGPLCAAALIVLLFIATQLNNSNNTK